MLIEIMKLSFDTTRSKACSAMKLSTIFGNNEMKAKKKT